MNFDYLTQSVLWAAIFSGIVLIIFWIEYRRTRGKLFEREKQMKRRMYELSILRELGERIGYSLNVQKIVDIISGSLANLLHYSIVAYMLPTEEGRLTFHISIAEGVSKDFLNEVRLRMLKGFEALFEKQYSPTDIDESVSGTVTDPNGSRNVGSFFNVPIVINDKPAGILTVAAARSGLYKTSEEVEILYTIMTQASEAVSKLETVLEVEKGKLNAMVSSMADGVLMVDNHTRMIVINPKATQMIGLNSKDPDGPSFFDVLDVLSGKFDLRTKIEESLKGDELVEEDEIQINNWFLQILITPVKDKHGESLGSVVLFHDVTREKELEKMREEFTSMMVHELRSPLTGIRSIATLLRTEKIKNEQKKYQEFVDLISTNSSSMLELVNDLLDVAKLEAGKFEVFKQQSDLRRVIEQRVKSFESVASENKVTLKAQVLPEVPNQMAFDENKIGQVFNNLLSNAIKFTEAGGEINISAFVCKQFEDVSDQAVARKLPWEGLAHGNLCVLDSVVIGITDTGTGIPRAEISKLFNKFQQLSTATRSEKKGTGLGLVIVKGIIEAHGGQVGVYSEEGSGTTFYFTLPLQEVKQGVKIESKVKVRQKV